MRQLKAYGSREARTGKRNAGVNSGGFLFGRITVIGGDSPPHEPTAVTGETLTVTVVTYLEQVGDTPPVPAPYL
ncbi:MAG: hypothetical protein FWH57_10250 [Oscillospiraceae bacterium]|nr:hypothetical protein [Oscillospiraceae bacterium]